MRDWCEETVTVTGSERKLTTRWRLPLLPSARDLRPLGIHTPARPFCLALRRLVAPISAASGDVWVTIAGGSKALYFTLGGAWKRPHTKEARESDV